MYYLCSKNKGADQLHGYCKADLRLCFRIYKKPVFSRRGPFYDLCSDNKGADQFRQVPRLICSDFIWPLLPPYKGVIPNPKMVYIFPILYILGIFFPNSLKKNPKCKGKGSFPKFQIKSLICNIFVSNVI